MAKAKIQIPLVLECFSVDKVLTDECYHYLALCDDGTKQYVGAVWLQDGEWTEFTVTPTRYGKGGKHTSRTDAETALRENLSPAP